MSFETFLIASMFQRIKDGFLFESLFGWVSSRNVVILIFLLNNLYGWLHAVLIKTSSKKNYLTLNFGVSNGKMDALFMIPRTFFSMKAIYVNDESGPTKMVKHQK